MTTPAQSIETGLARAQSCTDASHAHAQDIGLTGQQERAAQMVAQKKLTDTQVAAELGICRRTLSTWKTLPAFEERRAEHVALMANELYALSIANPEGRVRRRHEAVLKLDRIVEQRIEACHEQQRQHDEIADEIEEKRREILDIKAKRRKADFELQELLDLDIERLQDEIDLLEYRDPGAPLPGQDTGFVVVDQVPCRHGIKRVARLDQALIDAYERLGEGAAVDMDQRGKRIDLTTAGQALPGAQTVVFVLPPNGRDPIDDAIDITQGRS